MGSCMSELPQGGELPCNVIWPALEFTWHRNKLFCRLSHWALGFVSTAQPSLWNNTALQALTPAHASSLFSCPGMQDTFHFLQGIMLYPASGDFPFAGECLPLPLPASNIWILAKSYSSFRSQVSHHSLREAPIASHQLAYYTPLQLLVFRLFCLLC